MGLFTNWKERLLKTENLRLDPRNLRFAQRGKLMQEPQIIAYMLKNFDIKSIALSIATDGFFPEPIVVYKENGRFTVKEGNRRITAIKLLLDPEKAPKQYQTIYRKLHKDLKIDVSEIDQIKAWIADNPQKIDRYIKSRHSSSKIEVWKMLMRAQFWQQQQDLGKTVQQISTEFVVVPSEVKKHLIAANVYAIACTYDEVLDDEYMEKVRDPHNFPITTLERLYVNTTFKEFLGIEFDTEGKLICHLQRKQFDLVFSTVIYDLVKKERPETSRTLHTDEHIKDYIERLKDSLSDKFRSDDVEDNGKDQEGSFSSDDYKEKQEEEQEAPVNFQPKDDEGKKNKNRRPRSGRSVHSVIPAYFGEEVTIKNAKILSVFNELWKLPAHTYNKSAAMLLRALFENALYYHLEKRNLLDMKKNKNPTMRDMYKLITKDSDPLSLGKQVRESLQMLDQQGGMTHYYLDNLNKVVHSYAFSLDYVQLKVVWENLEAILKVLLKDPPDNQSQG